MFTLLSDRNAFGRPNKYRTASEAGIALTTAALIIAGAGDTDANGNYFEDGTLNGFTRYKHETNTVYFEMDSGSVDSWMITPVSADFFSSYSYQNSGTTIDTNPANWTLMMGSTPPFTSLTVN